MTTATQHTPGQICEWREHDVQTGQIVARHRVKLLHRDHWGDWVVRHLDDRTEGAGWLDWELYPVA